MTTLDTTSALDLDAIRRLIARSTDGPWVVVQQQANGRRWLAVVSHPDDEMTYANVAEVPLEPGDDINDWRNDAEFIAAARTDVPALLAEVDRLRAAQAAAPGQNKPPAGVDLTTWCAKAAANHRDYEEHELAMYTGDDRDRAIVEWVVRVLGNPELAESRSVLAVLAARHHDELAPTGTVDWLKTRVAELTAELAARRWSLPEEPTDVTAVRDRTGQLWVCPGRPGNNLWWRDKLGHGIGYEWHQLLQAGPLTPAAPEAVAR
ncbi:hypothetical protein E1258_27665 [Micromonospora sp. KC207]|uniref:hypothetical protein n=1 Tax=Micromonospora sp. KC207 TaxID=2530377 RepID=UPI00104CACE6|nr:hypothetical protein [Micromonospora sp. KC207]TDC48854.1 hypothetical protein E1258_27665 [Micromonospora sp. KC207]